MANCYTKTLKPTDVTKLSFCTVPNELHKLLLPHITPDQQPLIDKDKKKITIVAHDVDNNKDFELGYRFRCSSGIKRELCEKTGKEWMCFMKSIPLREDDAILFSWDEVGNKLLLRRKFQSEKAVAESPSGQAASVSPSSEVETTATPPLDRRKAAWQNGKTLNTEFTSWVQSELRDHPDELWEDGVGDYLAQASDIQEKFTDVVSWLKAKSGSEGSMSILGTQSNGKKYSPQTNSKDLNSVPSTSMFGMPSANAGFTPSSSIGASSTQTSPSLSFGLSASTQALSQSANTAPTISWSSGGVSFDTKSVSSITPCGFSTSSNFGVPSNNQAVSVASTSSFMSSASSVIFSNSQTPLFGSSKTDSQPSFMFGNQKSTAINDSAKEDVDEDSEPEQPSSPSVKRSEEKGIAVVHETKCKLYIKSTDPADKEPWKDKVAGKLFIKCKEGAGKGTKESKPRILVLNDVGKIMLNASLYPGIKTNLQENAIVSILHTADDNEGSGKAVARTFLIRVKNEDERNKLAETIREHAPAT